MHGQASGHRRPCGAGVAGGDVPSAGRLWPGAVATDVMHGLMDVVWWDGRVSLRPAACFGLCLMLHVDQRLQGPADGCAQYWWWNEQEQLQNNNLCKAISSLNSHSVQRQLLIMKLISQRELQHVSLAWAPGIHDVSLTQHLHSSYTNCIRTAECVIRSWCDFHQTRLCRSPYCGLYSALCEFLERCAFPCASASTCRLQREPASHERARKWAAVQK